MTIDLTAFLVGWIKIGFISAFVLHMTVFPAGFLAKLTREMVKE